MLSWIGTAKDAQECRDRNGGRRGRPAWQTQRFIYILTRGLGVHSHREPRGYAGYVSKPACLGPPSYEAVLLRPSPETECPPCTCLSLTKSAPAFAVSARWWLMRFEVETQPLLGPESTKQSSNAATSMTYWLSPMAAVLRWITCIWQSLTPQTFRFFFFY